jgi:uncharacterized protein (TIGR02145 family)/uncharacterized repeat protein (TIGR02543 family)
LLGKEREVKRRLLVMYTLFTASLLATVLALLHCAELDFVYDNPCDERGINYQGCHGWTITFDPNGGTVNSTSVTTGVGDTLGSLPTPTRTGYNFNGWYTASTSGTKVTEDMKYNGNTTIYAQWTLITYTITFNANYGTVATASGTTGEGWTLTSLPTPTRNDDYTFNGWYTAAIGGSEVSTTTAFSANAIIYARWLHPSVSTFVDSRDSKKYNKVTIDEQVWMAENLNYDVPNVTSDVCYGNRPDSCAKYGRLYDWGTAMGLEGSYYGTVWGGSDVKRQGVCPVGWHLPSNAEWNTLMTAVGGSSTAGRKLKSQSGWYNCGPAGSGSSYVCEDAYGFSALPGGYGGSDGGFYNAGNYGNWWSATEDDADYA